MDRQEAVERIRLQPLLVHLVVVHRSLVAVAQVATRVQTVSPVRPIQVVVGVVVALRAREVLGGVVAVGDMSARPLVAQRRHIHTVLAAEGPLVRLELVAVQVGQELPESL